MNTEIGIITETKTKQINRCKKNATVAGCVPPSPLSHPSLLVTSVHAKCFMVRGGEEGLEEKMQSEGVRV